MSDALPVDPVALREEVKSRYRAVAVDPALKTINGKPAAEFLKKGDGK